MKKIFLIQISIFLIISNLQAQDLIVTNSGDSINCKITKITKDYVHFTFKHNEEIRNTLLSANQITIQQKDYFSISELPANYSHKDIFPRFRVAIDGGWQYRTAKLADGIDAEWREHYRKMKSGFHYDLQAAYFFTESMGIEAMFSQQFFGNKLGYGTLSDINGNVIASGILNEEITFNYSGVNYIVRLLDLKKKNCFLMTMGLGYLGYDNKKLISGEQYEKITAGTLGTNIGFGYDIGISKNFDIGFKLTLMGGTFRNYKQTFNGITTNETMPEKTAEGLGTVKLSIGLRFNK